MNRVRVLLTFVLTLALPGVADAKFHLFGHRRPTAAPGGQLLGHHSAGQKPSKHKAHTRNGEGH